MDAIIIEGLKVETVIGCFNWERQIIQPLMLDMIIQTDLEQASNSDDLDHTLNYAEICEIAAKVIQDAKPELIEHAAKLVINAPLNKRSRSAANTCVSIFTAVMPIFSMFSAMSA